MGVVAKVGLASWRVWVG